MQKVTKWNKINNLNPFSKGQTLKLQTEKPILPQADSLKNCSSSEIQGHKLQFPGALRNIL